MNNKQAIHTEKAPAPGGAYSQAIKSGNTVYLAGQIAKSPVTGQLVTEDFRAETRQVFDNLAAVAQAAGGSLDQIVKLTVFLTDLQDFASVNEIMAQYFQMPYPARSTFQVSALPAGVHIEVEAIMVIG